MTNLATNILCHCSDNLDTLSRCLPGAAMGLTCRDRATRAR